MQFISSSYAKSHCRGRKSFPLGGWNHHGGIPAGHVRVNKDYSVGTANGMYLKLCCVRSNRDVFSTRATKSTKEPIDISLDDLESEKKGTIVGAVALVIGTSIGSGILIIPQKTSPAGFIPSAAAIVLCWGFLLIEALLLAEINSSLLKKKKKRRKTEEEELKIISIRTMAQETLGEWGGTLATVNYVFLGYSTMVAYTSKSGELIHHFSNIPSNISGFFFTVVFTILISVGGTRTTNQVNQWMTATMIGLLIVIEVLAVLSGGWSGFEATGNWTKIPSTIPVIIFTLVYHDIAPVICAYLGGDLARIRASLILGSAVPLVVLLVWIALALGLSAHADQVVDPVDLLMRVKWSGVSAMVEAFSLLAVGTSLLGTLLAFSQFFLEQLNNLSSLSPSTRTQMLESELSISEDESTLHGLKKWWGGNKFSITATAMAVAPPLLISTTVPDVFSTATDIAGGYCMTMLYGVLPPAMAWAMHAKSSYDSGSSNDINEGKQNKNNNERRTLSKVKPALIGVALFACAIVMEQILQDLSALHL